MTASESGLAGGPPLSLLSVLLVDDDDFVRRVTSRMLAALGVRRLRQASSAAAALDLVADRSTPLDVVISDLDMPDIDGMEFLRRLAQCRLDAGVLIMSGQDERILRSVQAMAGEYGLPVLGVLPKPISVHTLRDRLARAPIRHVPATRGPGDPASAHEIQLGIEGDQFGLVYQPKIDLRSDRVCGAEALVRWRHPTLGVLPPARYIGATEEYGLMDRLTAALLETAIVQMRRWDDAGLNMPVSLNVSLSSLADSGFARRVVETIARHGVSPRTFTIEVTETVAMTDVAHCLETLARLRMHGVGLSIDDFGTGHSSLQQLSRVPFTELKIDRSFVTGVSTQPHLRAIVEASVGMARKLGLTCVGEGIETDEDRTFLVDAGCEIGQGYLIARPMEADHLAEWVRLYGVRRVEGVRCVQ